MDSDRSPDNTAPLRPAHRLKHQAKRSKQNHLRLLGSATTPAQPSSTLWLCLHLPNLAVQAVCQNHCQPTVVTESSSHQVFIYSANEAALQQGIAPGHTLSSALALVSHLENYEREIKQEQRVLNRLASYAYRELSSLVSLDYKNSVLIEVGRSRQLWQRLDDIRERVNLWLDANNLTAELAWAPTPRAAYWLACSSLNHPVLCQAQIAGAIKDIRLKTVITNNRFKHSGLVTVGDIQRMPRAGLVRRGGGDLLKALDQALGKTPCLLHYWFPLPYFLEQQELVLPSANERILRPIIEALFASLARFLQQRQCVTRRLQLRFMHHDDPATVMTLGFTHNVANVSDMLRIFDVQSPRCQFIAEVTVVELCCRQLHAVSAEHKDLFVETSSGEGWEQLEELFEARFGDDYFKPLYHQADHRPEHAAKKGLCQVSKNGDGREDHSSNRPVWLLSRAQQLTTIQGQPYWQGSLQLDNSVERIEQGWWQGDDVRRDYYIATTDAGAKVWVYKDLRQQQWFLHGLFG